MGILGMGDYFMKQGKIIICLEEKLKEKGLSKNKFAQKAEMQRTQLNRYMKNEVALISVDVLARICSVLECDVSDILKYQEE